MIETVVVPIGIAVAGWVSRQGYEVGRRYYTGIRPTQALWRLNKELPVTIVTAEEKGDFPEDVSLRVYAQEYLAAQAVRSLAINYPIKKEMISLLSASECPPQNLTNNVVCIGGPVNNSVTREFLDRLDIPVRFDGHTVVTDGPGSPYVATLETKEIEAERPVPPETAGTDYGVAVFARNPFNTEAACVLLMGARTFGCAAAGQFATVDDQRGALRKVGPGEIRWAVVRADVFRRFVAHIEVSEASNFPRNLED